MENANSSNEDANIAKVGNTTKSDDEDEDISFFDLFAVLWRRKIMIILITLSALVVVVVISIVSIMLPPETSPFPNQFTSSAFMLITDNRTPLGTRETLFLDDINRRGIGGPTYGNLAIFLLRSNTLLDLLIDDFSLLEFENNNLPSRAESRRMLRNHFRAGFNEDNGVLTVSFTHIDPVFARDIVNSAVINLENRFIELGIDRNVNELANLELNLNNTFHDTLRLEEEHRRLEQTLIFAYIHGGDTPVIMADMNRISMELEAMRQVYTQLWARHEILRVTIASETPMFQILELAEVPYERSGPSRARLCIIVSLAAAFFAVLLAFALDAISSIRKNPVAMAKLRGANVQM